LKRIYEAVHKALDIQQVKFRCVNGKRIYCLFHPNLILEPLIFVSIALMNKFPCSIKEILQEFPKEYNESKSTVCVFYSISSAQKALEGIDLGNYLIKKVTKLLSQEFNNGIELFTTLSPIPSFCLWLYQKLETAQNDPDPFLTKLELESIDKLAISQHKGYKGVQYLIENPNLWIYNENFSNILKFPILRLCKKYLLFEKRKKFVLDPVCNFHLKNGAFIEQINWMADLSTQRMSESLGIMVNYVYDINKIEENCKLYSQGEIMHSSKLLEQQ